MLFYNCEIEMEKKLKINLKWLIRNFLDKKEFLNQGLVYEGIGR